uniref:DNA repair protein complementing XP-G cells n=1 Tax=Aceria tosichella TaxID=561515 RepID=A0A6G1SK24_9ACAR
MGVLGLWEVLESVGHPIKIEGLEGKILGVDANIWLYKFIRGFRDKDNATNIESHKLGLFNRISKLLYYRIKPVFVFDGPAPVLKRRTLERRQNTRNKHLVKVQDAALKILASQLKTQYPDADIDHIKITMPNLVSNNLVAAEKLTDEDRDLFYLPETGKLKNEDDDSDSDETDTRNTFNEHQYMTTDVDIHSKDFEQLPAETRYEILHDIKQSRKRIRNPENLPEDANSFSNFQLERLKARRKVQEKIENCEKEICTNYTGELADGSSIQAFRVQSDARATILYRNNTYDPKALEKVKNEESIKEEKEDDDDDDDEVVNLGNDNVKPATSSIEKSLTQSSANNGSLIGAYAKNVDTPGSVKVLADRLKSYRSVKDPEPSKIISPDLSESPESSSPEHISTASSPEQHPLTDASSSRLDSPTIIDKSDEQHSAEVSSQDLKSSTISSSSTEQQSPESHSLKESSPRALSPQPGPSKQSMSQASTVRDLNEYQGGEESDDEVTEVFPPPIIVNNFKKSANDTHNDSDISIIYDNNNRTITIDSDRDLTNRTELIDDSSESSDDEQPVDKPVEPTGTKVISNDLPPLQLSATDQPKNDATSGNFGDDESDWSESSDKHEEPKQQNTIKPPVGVVEENTMENTSVERNSRAPKSGEAETTSSQSTNFRPPTPTRTNKVTHKIIEDAKELLRLFGIPYIDAAGEAEAQCAKLEELKLTEGTITDDSDIWLFGSQNVYRYFFNDDKYVMQYKMTDIEFHIRMTRENLVCFAMLVGSDYTDGIMNVGPVTALEVLSQFQDKGMKPLVEFRKWHQEAMKDLKAAKKDKERRKLLKYRLPDEFPSKAVYDGYLRPVADTSTEKFTWGTPDLDELREYARRNFGWDPKKVDEKLVPVMKRLNERKIQKTIDTFFFKTQANRNPEMFRSKRVNQALNKIAKRAAREVKAPANVPDVLNLSEDDDD